MTQQIYLPTRIIFGEGSISSLGNLDYKNIFIICTKHLEPNYKDRLFEILGNRIEVFEQGPLKGEPSEEDIVRLSRKRSKKTDCIMGIGGGSYLDAAKALAIEGSLSKFSDKSKVLPIITVPTTAGTGSELTKSSIIFSGGIKKGIRSNKLFPALAVVDPTLTYNMPLDTTRYTAFDIFTHAIETFVSKKSSVFTRTISQKTIEELFVYFPRAIEEFEKNGSPSPETRKNLSYLAMLQGINLSNASTCIPHRVQYGISAFSDASHPKGLAAIYRPWLRLARPQIGKYDYKKLIHLMDVVGIKINLRDIGIKKSDLKKIADKVEGNLTDDPNYKGRKTIVKILEESL